MWTRQEFEQAAQRIGEDFVVDPDGGSINDRSLKVATDVGLNPEGIRTMVRLANVAAYEKIFEKKGEDGDPDRMVEFVVGDPEVVISQLHKRAEDAQSEKVAAAAYDQTVDYYSDIEYSQEREKVAAVATEEDAEPLLPSPLEVRGLFKRASNTLEEAGSQAAARWYLQLEKAANHVRATGSVPAEFGTLEKDAACALGEDCYPELHTLREMVFPHDSTTPVCGGVKLAEVISTYISSSKKEQLPIIELLKKAQAARQKKEAAFNGLEWIKNNVPKAK